MIEKRNWYLSFQRRQFKEDVQKVMLCYVMFSNRIAMEVTPLLSDLFGLCVDKFSLQMTPFFSLSI